MAVHGSLLEVYTLYSYIYIESYAFSAGSGIVAHYTLRAVEQGLIVN